MDELNRDLLLVVLALLTGAIPRAGLSAALKSWTKDRRQSLSELLKTQAGLESDRFQALECLADAHLKNHANDLRESLDAWNAHELTQDVLTEIGDDALRTTFASTLGGDETLPADKEPGAGPIPPGSDELTYLTQTERFRLIRPHAKGGIGQVWVARDRELQREVALKVIQDRFAERADQRARFQREAEITGNLEHPGIVPVYSLGRNPDGRPYYAMRFIRGESFSVAIRRFHKDWRSKEKGEGQRSGSQLGVEFRQLLARFLDVCDAMDYAHSRGVLHRDLKPANIMLGRYGETLVVDWGLAKLIGTSDVIPAAAGDFEPDLAGSTTVTGETQPGTTIGTPSYMSPEQARGSIEELGPASDVYSLGATLYELLAGVVAFPGEKAAEVIQKVLKGEFRPPRAVWRSVPAPLEAICLKAMAAEPAGRYSSVRELARDIEHWLADEPVAAYPERRLERLARWLRQHRTWTYAAAAALVGVTVVATAAAIVIERSRRREADAHAEAANNFAMAQKAVDEYLTSVSENILLKEQDSVDIRDLRRELLQKGLTYYEHFATQHSDDPMLRRELATAYSRVGDITQEIGSRHKAIEAYNAARTIWEVLALAKPEDPELRGRLADCTIALGKLQITIDNFEGAMKSLVHARALIEPLAASHPDSLAYQSSLAECYSQIGHAQLGLKSGDQGLDMLERAMAIQKRLVDQTAGNPAYVKSLAETTNKLGAVYNIRRDAKTALRSFQEVRDVCQSLLDRVKTGPKPVFVLHLLALSLYNIGEMEWQDQHVEEALKAYQKSLDVRSALAAQHPSVTQYKEKLGESWREIAQLQHLAKQQDNAFASIHNSLEVFKELVRSESDQARFHSELGISWGDLGYFYDEKRENQQAIPAFERAVAEQKRGIEMSQGSDNYKRSLCRNLENLGEQYLDLAQVPAALPYYQEAIEIRGALHAAHRDNPDFARELEDALLRFGTIQRHAGDSAAALKSYAEAQKLVEESRGDARPSDATLPSRRSTILSRKAAVLIDLDKPEKARELLEQALALVSSRASSADGATAERACCSEAYWELARVLRARPQWADAGQVDALRKGLWQKRPPEELVELCLKEAADAALVGYGKTTVSPRAEAVRKLDLDQAAANLRLAVSLGFNNLPLLRAHPEAALLLGRDDVKPLLLDMAFPSWPFDANSPRLTKP